VKFAADHRRLAAYLLVASAMFVSLYMLGPVAEHNPSAILYAIVAVIGMAVAGIVGVTVGGNGDSTPIATTIIGLVVPVVGVLLTMVKLEQVHRLVNSRADRQDDRAERQEELITQLLAERDNG